MIHIYTMKISSQEYMKNRRRFMRILVDDPLFRSNLFRLKYGSGFSGNPFA